MERVKTALLKASLSRTRKVTPISTHLEDHWGDEALDLGGLGLGFLALLAGEGALDNVLAHVVLLAQIEQLTDLGGTLGAQTAGHRAISQPGDLL